jgi:hypothetical protein
LSCATPIAEGSTRVRVRRVRFSDLRFDLLRIALCAGGCQLKAEFLALLISMAAAFYLAVSFSHKLM